MPTTNSFILAENTALPVILNVHLTRRLLSVNVESSNKYRIFEGQKSLLVTERHLINILKLGIFMNKQMKEKVKTCLQNMTGRK